MKPHPELDLASALRDRLPDLSAENVRNYGRKYVEERRDFIASLLLTAYQGHRSHRSVPQAIALSRDEIVTGLRVSANGNRYRALLAEFFDFAETNVGYSKQSKTTKAYTLRPRILRAIEDVFSGSAEIPVVWMNEGKRAKPPPKRAGNGIPPPLSTRLHVPSTFPLTVAQAERAITTVQTWIAETSEDTALAPSKPDGTTLRSALAQLHVIRAWVAALGGMPNNYVEQSHGRLGPSSSGHIIRLPKVLRNLLLQDSGLTDFDMVSCHPSIFVSLGEAVGFETAKMRAYIEHKRDHHAMWAHKTGHARHEDYKSLIVSFLNGASLTASPYSTMTRTLGTATMHTLRTCPHAVALQQEVSTGVQKIVEHAKHRSAGFTDQLLSNAAGKTLPLHESLSIGKRAAHILTGLEQFALREMLSGETGVRAVIYDGWISSPLNLRTLEDRVKHAAISRLGFPLEIRLRAEPFGAPVETPRLLDP